MLLLKTSKETLPQVIKYSKHALMRCPRYIPGEIALIGQTMAGLPYSQKTIRYRMEILNIYLDKYDESIKIWNHKWNYIVEGYNLYELQNPFDIKDFQVTDRNYQQGGTVFHIDSKDCVALVQNNLLKISL